VLVLNRFRSRTSLHPFRVKAWGPHQRLHDYAVLLGLFSQGAQLIRASLRRNHIKAHANRFETDRHIFGKSQRAPQVKISLDADLDTFGSDSHRGSNHLARDLRASRQRSEQKVSRTGGCTRASDSNVGFSLVNGSPYVYRTRHRSSGSVAFRPECDPRCTRVSSVLLLQRLLNSSNIHGNLASVVTAPFGLSREEAWSASWTENGMASWPAPRFHNAPAASRMFASEHTPPGIANQSGMAIAYRS
jgi:hypothetical protein